MVNSRPVRLLPYADEASSPRDAFLKIAFQLQDAFNKTKQRESGHQVFSVKPSMIGTRQYELLKAFGRAKNIDEMNILYKNGPPAHFSDSIYNIFGRKNEYYMNGVISQNYSTALNYLKALSIARPTTISVSNLYDSNGNPLH